LFFSKLSSGNRLHYLVIDYHSLGCLGNTLFWGKAWSWINLEAMLVCWSNLVLILKQCFNLWMFVEVILKATLFDYSLTSSKSCIHTFIISPFLMMTIIIKWILLSIIKTCIIHILPLFDDENNYQANSFQYHQNLKLAWFTYDSWSWTRVFSASTCPYV